jgi:hypothetical protein
MNGDNNNDMLVRYGISAGRRYRRIVLFAGIRAYGPPSPAETTVADCKEVAGSGSDAVLVVSAEQEEGQASKDCSLQRFLQLNLL